MSDVALLIVFFLVIANYYFIYYFFFGEKLKCYPVSIICGIFMELLYILTGRRYEDLYWIGLYLAPLLILAIIQLCSKAWKPIKILVIFFAETCLSEITSGIIELFTLGIGIKITYLQRALWVFILLALLWVILILLKKHLSNPQKDKMRHLLQRNILVSVIIMAMIIMFTVAGLNLAKNYIENPRFQMLVIGLTSLSYGCVGLLVFFTYYMYTTNQKVETMMEKQIHMKDMQKKYYDTLLERENDTRKFRHDMSNHLICLENLAREDNLEALRKYLGQMREQMQEIQKKSYSVGNDILNILTNHYVSLLDDNTRVTVSGFIHTGTDEMKLCTIYANLLQNAVEELEQCEGECFLEITFRQGKEFFQIEIRNSLSEQHQKDWSSQYLRTRKKDQRNHGIGIVNVKKTVEELGGIVTFNRLGDSFQASVSLRA